jgi:hypothetical protein
MVQRLNAPVDYVGGKTRRSGGDAEDRRGSVTGYRQRRGSTPRQPRLSPYEASASARRGALTSEVIGVLIGLYYDARI